MPTGSSASLTPGVVGPDDDDERSARVRVLGPVPAVLLGAGDVAHDDVRGEGGDQRRERVGGSGDRQHRSRIWDAVPGLAGGGLVGPAALAAFTGLGGGEGQHARVRGGADEQAEGVELVGRETAAPGDRLDALIKLA